MISRATLAIIAAGMLTINAYGAQPLTRPSPSSVAPYFKSDPSSNQEQTAEAPAPNSAKDVTKLSVSEPSAPASSPRVLLGPPVSETAKSDVANKLKIDAAYADYYVRYYRFLVEQADLNVSILKWQRAASEKLLWVVILVVISGITFSGFQLYHATRLRATVPEAPNSSEMPDAQQQASNPNVTEIELSVDKVRITSSVVGLVVLTLSLAFFYLFIVEVYRITPVTLTPVAAQK